MNAENDKITEKVSLTITYSHPRSIKDLSFSEQVNLKLRLERLGVAELFEATKELPSMIEENKKKQPSFVGKAYLGQVAGNRLYKVVYITESLREKEVRVNSILLQIGDIGLILRDKELGKLIGGFSFTAGRVKIGNYFYSEIPYQTFENLWIACGKLIDIKVELGL